MKIKAFSKIKLHQILWNIIVYPVKNMKYFLWSLLICACLFSCKNETSYNTKSVPTKDFSPDLVIEWWELIYEMVAYERIKPPVASRVYAYLGVAVYESVLPGMPEYVSMSSQIGHLEGLPMPDNSLRYDWSTVMVNTLYLVVDELFSRFIHTDENRLLKLKNKQLTICKSRLAPEIYERSVAHGLALSKALILWMQKDNFDDTRFYSFYTVPSRNVKFENWEPTDLNVVACEPYWSGVRPFVLESGEQCHEELPVAFSAEKSSPFYKAVEEVLNYDRSLTEAQRDIAFHWADDPGETSTPPGHWTIIMNYAAKKSELNLEEVAAMYALVGVGIADAFIASWYSKYKVNLLRPKTYIHDYFPDGEGWEPLVETPPFPEYTSAHAVVSTVASEILIKLLGENYNLMDSTHVRIGLPVREIKNFREAAFEAGMSRLYGGIHYKFSVDAGFRQGQCVVDKILKSIRLRKDGGDFSFMRSKN